MTRELEGWPEDSIIEPVSQSKWASPLTPVFKGDGIIRIGADLKDTINQALKESRYLILCTNDLIAKYAKGRMFNKINVSQLFLRFLYKTPGVYSRSLPTRAAFALPSHRSV
ncbi:unnamed protein product [Gordionus sp. m RMFG-2023]